MTFGELQVGDRFTRSSSDKLIWNKCNPFTAYGHILNQNGAAYSQPNGPWHYDKIDDKEEVKRFSPTELEAYQLSTGKKS